MICKIGFGDDHIVLFFGRKIERTSCTFKHLRNIDLPFGEIKQCEHPGDQGKNFCPLRLIDFSVIAIHAYGGGVQLETDSFICDMTKHQS